MCVFMCLCNCVLCVPNVYVCGIVMLFEIVCSCDCMMNNCVYPCVYVSVCASVGFMKDCIHTCA